MNKFLLFKLSQKTSPKEAGFSTLEILISLIIALLFVALTMQSLVYSMAMKVQAQEKQKANELIQEDIERINQLGSTLAAGTAGNRPFCNPTSYEDGYASALWNLLPLATQTKTVIKKVKSDGSVDTGGKQLALRRFHVSSTINSHPYRTLRVGYQVWNWNGSNYTNQIGGTITANDEPIAETYVEIIPDVALQCP